MVDSQADAEKALEAARRNERLAKAFEERGQTERAKRLRKRASAQRVPAENRLTALNPEPQLLSSGQIQQIGGSSDRGLVLAQLRAQEAKAKELLERARARDDRDDEREFSRVLFGTQGVRELLEREKGSGVPESFELRIGRARFPEKDETTLRRKFGTDTQREKARSVASRDRATDRAQEAAGFEGSSQEFITREREKERESQKSAAEEQRLRFVASGESKTATPAEVIGARRELERRGVKIFSQLESGGRTFERGTGSAELPGEVLGIRTVAGAEQGQREKTGRVIATRLAPGIQRDNRGNVVLVREGAKGGQTAGELFRELGAPEVERERSIEFGRPKSFLFKREGFFPELSLQRDGVEVSRKSTVRESIVTVPNVASAQLAGFPTEQEGVAIEFPARFRVVSEKREDKPRKTVFAPISEGLERVDKAAVSVSESRLGSLPPFSAVTGIRAVGEGAERAGSSIAEGGAKLQELGKGVAERDEFVAGPLGKLLSVQGSAKRFTGEFIQEEGRLARERPVTFGAGEAFLIGSGFGAVSELVGLARVSRAAQRATVTGRFIRGTLAAARGVELAGGAALTGAFAVQTVEAVRTSDRPGAELARAVNQLGGFVVGARVGGVVAEGTVGVVQATGRGARVPFDTLLESRRQAQIFKANRRLEGSLITRDTARELAALDRSLSVNVKVRPVLGRATLIETAEVAGKRTVETTRAEIQGSREEFSGAEFAKLQDTFLVERSAQKRVLEGPASQSKTRQPSESLFIRESRVQTERSVQTLDELVQGGPRGFEPGLVRGEGPGFVIQRARIVREGSAPVTGRRFGQLLEVERFQPIELSGETGLARTFGRNEPRPRQARRIGTEPGQVTGRNVGELEKLDPFTEGKDFFTLDRLSGEFRLSRTFERRPFQRGRTGGRRTRESGTLPEAAETQLNLPRELATEFAKTPKGRAFLAERGLFRIERIKSRKDGKKARGRDSEPSGTTLSDTVEVDAGGGQVQIKKRAARTTSEQKTKTETRQETVLETELARQKRQRQEQQAQTRQEARTESLQQNRFASLTQAFRKSFSRGTASALLSKRIQASRLRTVPRIDQATQQSQLFKQASLLDEASKQDQTPAEITETIQEQDQGRRGRQRTRQFQKFQRPRITQESFRRTLVPPETPVTPGGLPSTFQNGLGAPGFQVLVRRGGQFQLATSRVLTRGQALELGASIADTGPAQQFKLRETGQRAERGGREPTQSRLDSLLKKFTRKGETFRERQKNLIDTAGEIQTITLKGVQASSRSRRQLRRLGL